MHIGIQFKVIAGERKAVTPPMALCSCQCDQSQLATIDNFRRLLHISRKPSHIHWDAGDGTKLCKKCEQISQKLSEQLIEVVVPADKIEQVIANANKKSPNVGSSEWYRDAANLRYFVTVGMMRRFCAEHGLRLSLEKSKYVFTHNGSVRARYVPQKKR